MRCVRVVGLCLVPAFVLALASTAHAGTYYWCRSQPSGEYANSTCTTKAAQKGKGKFEKKIMQECEAVKNGEYTNSTCMSKASRKGKGKFEKTKGRGYTSVGGKAELATPDFGPGKVICNANTDAGEYTGNTGKTGLDRVEFTGCSFEGLPCKSEGENATQGAAGEIVTNLLESRLVDNPETITFLNAETNKAETKGPAVGEVWEELKSSEHEPYSSEFNCADVVFLRTQGQDTGVLKIVNSGVKKEQEAEFEAGKGADGLLTEVLTEAGWQGPAPSIEEAATAKITSETPIEACEPVEIRSGIRSGRAAQPFGCEGGSVEGTVSNDAGPVPGALVTVYQPQPHGQRYQVYTEGNGSYEVRNVEPGTYLVKASPPTGAKGNLVISGEFKVSVAAEATEDLYLPPVTPVPPGTTIKGGLGVAEVEGAEVPVLKVNSPTPIETEACTEQFSPEQCAGAVTTVTIAATNSGNGVREEKGPFGLGEESNGSGTFAGSVPALGPLEGFARVKITIEVSLTIKITIEATVFIDPSGTVLDGDHADAPITDATVTLLSAESLSGKFSAVPEGSPVMSPANRLNPDTTNGEGAFGWDVVPGYYKVTASKPGCGTATTAAFEVPPPVTELQLVLHCASPLRIESTTLPPAQRGVPYHVQLTASGGRLPYKWKKGSTLPKGLKVSKAGVLSGTPSTKLAAGEYSIGVSVSDTSKPKQTATATLTLAIS